MDDDEKRAEAERTLLEIDLKRALADLDAGRVLPWENAKRELERLFAEERNPMSNVSLVRAALQDIDALPAMVLVALTTPCRTCTRDSGPGTAFDRCTPPRGLRSLAARGAAM